MYEAGFVVFVAGSLACALSWNEASLVIFRVAQGVGGALITANSGIRVVAVSVLDQRPDRDHGGAIPRRALVDRRERERRPIDWWG